MVEENLQLHQGECQVMSLRRHLGLRQGYHPVRMAFLLRQEYLSLSLWKLQQQARAQLHQLIRTLCLIHVSGIGTRCPPTFCLGQIKLHGISMVGGLR